MPGRFHYMKDYDDIYVDTSKMVVLPESQTTNNRLGSSSNISTNGDICRICHCEADINNPLLSPCYCSGSLKYVHQSCLQQWLATSDTRSCELCKFNFILHTKIKPIGEWRRLEMSSVERRRLLCAILFHFVAAMCVVWSLFVLIDRAAEEVQKGLIAWPFWTKLVVVAVGFTGGAVFMYIQCRQYLHLFSRWKAHNRIILVQNAPEKVIMPPPSPSFTITVKPSTTQVVANIESTSTRNYQQQQQQLQESNYYFDGSRTDTMMAMDEPRSAPMHSSTTICCSKKTDNYFNVQKENDRLKTNSPYFDHLEHTIQEVLALDLEHTQARRSKTARDSLNSIGLEPCKLSEPIDRSKTVFKSLPNISFNKGNLSE